jgi:hypothetical protein
MNTRCILSNGKRHLCDMGSTEVEGFLSALAVEGQVAGTQNQALLALLFLYREVLSIEWPWNGDDRAVETATAGADGTLARPYGLAEARASALAARRSRLRALRSRRSCCHR